MGFELKHLELRSYLFRHRERRLSTGMKSKEVKKSPNMYEFTQRIFSECCETDRIVTTRQACGGESEGQ